MLLSVVLCGRNDDFREGYAERLNNTIQSLKEGLDGIEWELILVDYNGPPGADPLSHLLSAQINNVVHVIIKRQDHVKLADYHKSIGARLQHNCINTKDRGIEFKDDDFAGAVAYNEGIRHSVGDYVLITAVDNLFSTKYGPAVGPGRLADHFQRMSPNVVLRATKIKRHHKEGTIKMRDNIWQACGDFMLTDRESWFEVGGYLPLPYPYAYNVDGQLLHQWACHGKMIRLLHYGFENIDFPRSNPKINYQIWQDEECVFDQIVSMGNKKFKIFKDQARRNNNFKLNPKDHIGKVSLVEKFYSLIDDNVLGNIRRKKTIEEDRI